MRPSIKPLPREARPLEHQLAKALAQHIIECREMLTDSEHQYSDEYYDELEQRMIDSADKLGRLRQQVAARLKNENKA